MSQYRGVLATQTWCHDATKSDAELLGHTLQELVTDEPPANMLSTDIQPILKLSKNDGEPGWAAQRA